MNGAVDDVRPENLAAVPFKTTDTNLVIAPYRKRIRELEKELKSSIREN